MALKDTSIGTSQELGQENAFGINAPLEKMFDTMIPVAEPRPRETRLACLGQRDSGVANLFSTVSINGLGSLTRVSLTSRIRSFNSSRPVKYRYFEARGWR